MLLRLFNLLKLGAQVLLSLLVAVRAKELQIVFVDPDLRITVLIQQDLKAVRELHDRDVGSDILHGLSGVKTLCRKRIKLADPLKGSNDAIQRLSELLSKLRQLVFGELRHKLIDNRPLDIPVCVASHINLFEKTFTGAGGANACRLQIAHDIEIRLCILCRQSENVHQVRSGQTKETAVVQ